MEELFNYCISVNQRYVCVHDKNTTMPYKNESSFVRTMSDIHDTITSFVEHFPNKTVNLVKIDGYVSVKGEDCYSRKDYNFNKIEDIVGVMANVNLTEDWSISAPFDHSDGMIEQLPDMTEEWYDNDVYGSKIATRNLTITSLDNEYLTEAGILEEYNERGFVTIDRTFEKTEMEVLLKCL
ncbi:MAG: hypothetical protein ACRC92_17310 [Peptostreptococcaceae bacterium]